MDIIEKAQRLQELGKLLEADTPTANLINAALELVAELAQRVAGLEEELAGLAEELDDLDDAMAEIAEDIYGEDDEDSVFEVECPNCGELVQIDEGILRDGSITCPGCDETLEFEFGCDCDACGCEGCEGKD